VRGERERAREKIHRHTNTHNNVHVHTHTHTHICISAHGCDYGVGEAVARPEEKENAQTSVKLIPN
jgi:hypothetical protein